MSKLDELLQQYCPNGVEYKPLKDVSLMQRGTSITKAQAHDGIYPVISGGREPAFYCDRFNRDGETVTVAGSGAGAGYVQYFNEPLFANDCFTVKGLAGVSTKYLYYCMTWMQERISGTKKGGGVPHVHISDIDRFEIPVPSLPVQQEIVRILDKFTELEAELEAELQLRKKQYEWHRDQLLTFRRDGRTDVLPWVQRLLDQYAPNGVEWKPLKELVARSITKGTTPTTISYGYEPNGVSFIKVETISNSGFFIREKMEHISDECNNKMFRSQLKESDILFSIAGAIGRVGIVPRSILPANINQALAIIRVKQDICIPLYVKYYLETSMALSECVSKKTGAAQPNVSLEKLGCIYVPIPPLPVQEAIVSALDSFSTLLIDISSGIPAEIASRRKQYEYYRDKLLSF